MISRLIFIFLIFLYSFPALAHKEKLILKRINKSLCSVVNISSKKTTTDGNWARNPFALFYFGSKNYLPQTNYASNGSGVIIHRTGLVLTNYHVVSKENALNLIIFLDGTKVYSELVYLDKSKDLAILKLNKLPSKLCVARFGSSKKLNLGSTVYAIGSPFGLFHSLSKGIISAKNRLSPMIKHQPLIQTDAAINPGNSGGALLDTNGKLIGINTIMIYHGGYRGIGFAIPAETIKSFLTRYLKNDKKNSVDSNRIKPSFR